MLCLHGALGTAAQFDALRPFFPEGFPLLVPNLPGHGGLPLDRPYALPNFAAAVLAILDKAQIEQTDVFGYSMGGYVALWLAWKHPERVRRVVTLNTKLDWSSETATRMSGLFDPDKISAKVPQFADALARAHAPADWRAVAQYTADLLHTFGAGQGLPPAAFAQISCPVLVLRGELDTTVTAEESQQVAAWLPNGRYGEIVGGRHALEQVDAGALVAEVLRNVGEV